MSSTDAFADQPEAQLQHDSTLFVDKSVSLSLGSDSLLIVGMASPSDRGEETFFANSLQTIAPFANTTVTAAGYAGQVSGDPSCWLLRRSAKARRRLRLCCILWLMVDTPHREDKEYASHLVVQCP